MKGFLIGLAAGCFGGLVGLGGGVIMIPLMTGVLGLRQHTAHGTSIAVIVFSSLAGGLAYAVNGDIDIPASGIIALFAVATSSLGARFADSLSEWKLRMAFGSFLLFVAAMLLAKPFLPDVSGLSAWWVDCIVLSLTGISTGFLSGMLGVGGGTVMVPVLVLLLGFSQRSAQGTSLLAMLPIGLMGSYTHWKLGNVAKGELPKIIPGAVLGAALAGLAAGFVPQDALRYLFCAVLLFTGAKYLCRTDAGKDGP